MLEEGRIYRLTLPDETILLHARQEDEATWLLEESTGSTPRKYLLYRGRIKQIINDNPWKRSLYPVTIANVIDLILVE